MFPSLYPPQFTVFYTKPLYHVNRLKTRWATTPPVELAAELGSQPAAGVSPPPLTRPNPQQAKGQPEPRSRRTDTPTEIAPRGAAQREAGMARAPLLRPTANASDGT